MRIQAITPEGIIDCDQPVKNAYRYRIVLSDGRVFPVWYCNFEAPKARIDTVRRHQGFSKLLADSRV